MVKNFDSAIVRQLAFSIIYLDSLVVVQNGLVDKSVDKAVKAKFLVEKRKYSVMFFHG